MAAADNILTPPDFAVKLPSPNAQGYDSFVEKHGLSVIATFTPKDGATAANKECFYWMQEVKQSEWLRFPGKSTDVITKPGKWTLDGGNEKYPVQSWNKGTLTLRDSPSLNIPLPTTKSGSPPNELLVLATTEPERAIQDWLRAYPLTEP